MPSTDPRPRLRALLAAAGLTAGVILAPTAVGTVEAAEPPTFSVRPPHQVWGHGDGWPLGATIDLTVTTTDDPPVTLYTADPTTVGSWGPEPWEQGFDFHLEGLFDIQPGQRVTITAEFDPSNAGPEITKALVVDDVTVTVDEAALSVSGTSTGPDGAMVHVSFGAVWRDVPVSGELWVAAFGVAPEPDAGHGTLTTFGGTMSLTASVLDGDDDATSVHLTSPSIHVSPWNDFMWGNEFAPGDPVSVRVDGLEIETPTPDAWGYFELDMPFDPDTTVAAVQHGWIADVSVADLLIVAVNDPTPGIVSGSAPDGALVDVHAWAEHGWASRVTTASGGTFTVDFSEPGGPQSWGPDPLDLIPGTQVRAHIYDDRDLPDHDATYNDVCVGECGDPGGGGGEPRIQAFLNDEAFGGEHFTPDAEVLVTLYEFDGGVPLIGPDEPFGTNDEGHFEGRDLLEQGLQPGMVLEVHDEQLDVTKRLEFVDIRFDSFDPDTNVVAGSVFDRPSDDIFVQLADQDYEPIVDEFGNPIRVNVDGTSWWLDLDDVGYDPGGLTEARVEVGVGDGETLARLPQVIVTVPHTVQSADFDSDVTSGVTVQLIDHTTDGTVVVTIDDVDVNLRGEFAVPTEEYGVDLDPGDEITVTSNDTGVVKHHIVFELTIDEVDFENDTIRGTAAPGVWISVGGEFVHERVWSGEGDWTVTFENGIEEGMLFGASIGDPDLDFTVVETTPPAFISAEPFREIVRAEFFPVGNQLELIVSDDGATVLGPLTATVEGQRLEWFLLPDGFDLEPGHLVTVTDLTASETELFRRELIVADIGVTEVDDVDDVVRGTVSTPDPYPGVFVAAGTESAGGERFIENDGTGIWEADFGGEVDIDKTQPWNLFIRVPDADEEPADATIFAMPEASPGLLVEPYLDVITTEGSGLGDITIRIPELDYEFTATPEHAGGPLDLFPGLEFDPFALAGSEVFTYGIGVDLAGQIDLVPGMLVQASGVLWEMEMTVTDFVVDEVDSANDTVAGVNPLPETPEGPGLVGTFTSGPTAFGFELPETERWELTMTAILDGEPGGPYDIDGTEVGISFGTPTDDQPYDTYTAMLWDLRPHITSLLLPVDTVEVGTAVDLSATFTDLDVADTHTVRIDWGDDTDTIVFESDPVVDQLHVYTEPGIHTVELTVTDAFGQTDTATHQFVVVYDPSAGFVTGGGWIDSPAGAYAADPELTGKADFGFVSKYKRGKSTPDGNANFQFQTADLHLQSTEFEWLVITGGDHAKFAGIGTINGAGDYGFMITAVDDPDGDTFRIKIWDRESGDTVYDNKLGGDDDGTLLGGGSIVVHTAKQK